MVSSEPTDLVTLRQRRPATRYSLLTTHTTSVLTDLKSAWRYVSRQPGFSLLAIVSLAVAIGVNATMFSVVNGFLLRDAVEEDPARYVGVFGTTQDAARTFRPFSLAEYNALRADDTVFADISAVYFSQVALGDRTDAKRVFAFLVSENFFSLAGVRPAAGRFFSPDEAAPNSGAAVVVASHGLWRAQGFRADFLGSTLPVNGRVCTVIGVAPEGFSGASPLLAPAVWLPLGLFRDVAPAFGGARVSPDLAAPGNEHLQLFARLQPPLTRRTAAPLLPVLAQRLAAVSREPASTPRELVLARPLGISPQPASESAFGPVTALTLGLSALVLIIACLNLSNLLLARGSTRTVEIATRLALGASRARIVRQLLAESLLLGLAGGVLGVACSLWVGSFLAQVLADRVADFGFVVVAAFTPDTRVLVAMTVVSLLACAAFGLGPALRASRIDLVHDLKAGAGGAITGSGRSRWSGRNLLLVLQAAISFVLLFAAGLFLRSALAAAEPPAGLELSRRSVAEIDFSLQPATPAQIRGRLFRALENVRHVPGLAAAGLTSLVPYANDVQLSLTDRIDSSETNRRPVIGAFSAVSDGYATSIASLLRGRDFSLAEAADPAAPPVCLIDDVLARRLFPQADPLGQSLRIRGGPRNQVDGVFTIVGVVAAHSQDVADRAQPFPRVFVPLARVEHPLWFLVVKSAASAPDADVAAARLVEATLRATDPDLPLVGTRSLTGLVDRNFSRWQAGVGAVLFSVFGVIAALLAAVGIHGVTAYATTRRTREIGLRLALGAGPADIARLVAGGGLDQLAMACLIGGLASWGLGTALAGFVPDIRAFDPWALLLAASTLLFATSPALWLPTRRAMRVDPLVALRAE